MSLSWTGAAGETYNILRSTTSGSGYTPIATGVNLTIYGDNSAADGTTYYYVVTASEDGVTSGNSNQVNATPYANADILMAVGAGTQINLSWSQAPGEDGYTLYRSLSPYGGFTMLAAFSSTATSYSDTTAQPNTDYWYELTASGSTGTPYNVAEASTASNTYGFYNVTYSGGTSNNSVPWQLGTFNAGSSQDLMIIPDIFCLSGSQGAPDGGQCSGPISAYFSWQGGGDPPPQVAVYVFSQEVAACDSLSYLDADDGFGLAESGTWSSQYLEVGDGSGSGAASVHTYYIQNPGPFFTIPDAFPIAAAGTPESTGAWFSAVYAAMAYPVPPPTVNIVADTNRDGQITAADQTGRGTFSATSGAIYNVNFGKNNTNKNIPDPTLPPPAQGQPANDPLVVTDSLTFARDGTVANEDTVINGSTDVPNITPFQITVSGNAPGWRYFLMTNDSSVRAIHVFPSISANAQSILGGPTSTINDSTPGAGQCLQAEITQYIPQQSGKAVTMGLEGLAFAGMQIRNPGETAPWNMAAGQQASNPTQVTFNGVVTLTLQGRLYAQDGTTVLATTTPDQIQLGVAPFLLRSNVDASTQVWVANGQGGNYALGPTSPYGLGNAPLVNALQATGQLNLGTLDDGDQWYQDCCEIGYTYRPGQAPRDCVFELPHDADRPFWVQNQLLNANTNLFYLGNMLYPNSYVGFVSGDFGGNVDCIPPSPQYPLGNVLIGNTASPALTAFLSAQGVQPVVTLFTSWLEVGHVDEMLQFIPNSATGQLQCVLASPSTALTELQGFAGTASQSGFFADGRNAAAGFKVLAGGTGVSLTQSPSGSWQMTLPLTSPPNAVVSTNPSPDDLWVVMTTGSAQGLAFQVSSIDQSTGVHSLAGYAYGCPNSVMNVPNGISPPTPSNVYAEYLISAMVPETSGQFSQAVGLITQQDNFMVVDGMKFWWANGSAPPGLPSFVGTTPSAISVAELALDPALASYNNIPDNETFLAQLVISEMVGQGNVQFIQVPTLYMRNYLDMGSSALSTDRSGFALTPGIANLQVVGNQVFSPNPLGYSNFTVGLATAIPGLEPVDDWDMYHRLTGEIHCGTNVRRTGTPKTNWWNLIPTG